MIMIVCVCVCVCVVHMLMCEEACLSSSSNQGIVKPNQMYADWISMNCEGKKQTQRSSFVTFIDPYVNHLLIALYSVIIFHILHHLIFLVEIWYKYTC